MSDEVQNETAATAEVPSGSAGLEVEGEAGVYWCARHRKVQTRLRCGRCETPICAKCTVYGPTGARCKNCASNRGSHMYQVAPTGYAAAIGVSLLLGLLLGFVTPYIGLFAIFYAPLAGVLMGRAISFVTKNKRGLPLALIGSFGIVAGAFLPLLPHLGAILRSAFSATASSPEALMGSGIATILYTLLYVGLALPGVWYWLK